jgi:uncharacterized repeat protein (TIGR01451 family)
MKAGSRHAKRLGLSVLAIAALGATAGSAFAASVEPAVVAGNPKCADLGQGLSGFKPSSPSEANPTGTHSVNGGAITIVANGQGLTSWNSTFGIDKVIVKGGNSANVYTYSPEAFGDTNLGTPLNNGGQTAGLSHVEFCYDADPYNPPPKYPTVTKTAGASFDRTFDWTIVKSVDKSSVTTTDNTATFNYTVVATKLAGVDSNFKVTGAIAVGNPFEGSVDLVVTDDILGRDDETCIVDGGNGAVHTIPAGGAVLNYSCTLPTKADGINKVTIDYAMQAATVEGGPLGSFEAPFTFGDPVKVTNNRVDVTDAFNGAAAPGTLLEGGDDITESKTFTYSRTVDVPASGCTTYPNIAYITSPDGLSKNDDASVQACREVPPVNPPANPQPQPQPQPQASTPVAVLGATIAPKAKLAVTKTGPRAATAGQIVTYTIRVKNTGKANATSVVLRDLLPSGYSLSGKVKGATFKAGALSWKFGTLAPGKSKTVKATFRINRSVGGRRCNVATAAASGVVTVRDTACTRIAAVAGAIQPAVTG